MANAGTALIVGGASGGIGRAVAKVVAQRFPDWQLVVTSSKSDMEHERAKVFQLDLKAPETIARTAKSVEEITKEKNSPLRFVFNCTGVLHNDMSGPERSIKDLSEEFLLENLRINTIGWALLAKEFFPLLKASAKATKQGYGWPTWPILATISARVGSIGDNSLGGWYSYRCSKAAQNQLTRTLALELQRHNIMCIAMHPGTVDSELSKPFQKGVKPEKLFSTDQSANYMLDVMQTLQDPKHDTGYLYAWDGEKIPW